MATDRQPAGTAIERWIRRTALALALAWLGALPSPAGAGTPSLDELIIEWSRGRYASPVFCELGSGLVRGIRRIVIKPESHPARRPTLSVQLIDMRPEDATRCVNSVGRGIPNAIGRLRLTRVDRPHPETGSRDFKQGLRKDRGFDFRIASGVLKLQDVTEEPSEPRIVDFVGGAGRIGLVLPATDGQRELADFQSPRKRLLTLESPGGETLVFPIFVFDED